MHKHHHLGRKRRKALIQGILAEDRMKLSFGPSGLILVSVRKRA